MTFRLIAAVVVLFSSSFAALADDLAGAIYRITYSPARRP